MNAVEHVGVEDPVAILARVPGGVEQIASAGKDIPGGVKADRDMLVEETGTGRHIHAVTLDRRRDFILGQPGRKAEVTGERTAGLRLAGGNASRRQQQAEQG